MHHKANNQIIGKLSRTKAQQSLNFNINLIKVNCNKNNN